ncbi:protease inhibitor I42 family protein [Streptomyces huiliensis]|uniref:protease inhibitor I42 family protein n=1 Tax=Streptomyces huiliensis TaxID=2876027 RepID=UPI001CBCBC94|nr:protease inhibitor I42 family protein [Streptomyces huiliensis]MBZ4320867.1 protease inhibitor I42 family protein [Streptomyces huiliensis]
MNRSRRSAGSTVLLSLGAALLALAVTACGSGDGGGGKGHEKEKPAAEGGEHDRRGMLGTVHEDRMPPYDPARPNPRDRTEATLTVRSGERFTIAMRKSASARLDWSLSGPGPDRKVVRPAGTSTYQTEREKELIGSSYAHYFTFEAAGPGTTRIVLTNRCGSDRKAGCYSPELARSVTYPVTVR